jgi:hypothetical protein
MAIDELLEAPVARAELAQTAHALRRALAAPR